MKNEYVFECKFCNKKNDITTEVVEYINEEIKGKELILKKEAEDSMNFELEKKRKEIEIFFNKEYSKKIKENEEKLEIIKKNEIEEIELKLENKFKNDLSKKENENFDLLNEIKKQKKFIEGLEKDKELEIEKEKIRLSKEYENKVEQEKLNLNKELKIKIKKEIEEENKNKEIELSKKEKELKEKEKEIETIKETNNLEIQRLKNKLNEIEKSQEIKGEVEEEIIKGWLREWFRYDLIEDVPKGVKGADLIQTIFGNNQLIKNDFSSKIIYEVKNTKEFKNEYITKLLNDVSKINNAYGVIVTKTLPKDMKDNNDKIKIYNNGSIIIVSSEKEIFKSTIFFLREAIIQYDKLKNNSNNEIKDKLFDLINSVQFDQNIALINKYFEKSKEDLNKLKKKFDKYHKDQINRIEFSEEAIMNIKSKIEVLLDKKIIINEENNNNFIEEEKENE